MVTFVRCLQLPWGHRQDLAGEKDVDQGPTASVNWAGLPAQRVLLHLRVCVFRVEGLGFRA